MQFSMLLDSTAGETVREVGFSCMTELLFSWAVRSNCCNIMGRGRRGRGGEGEEAVIELLQYINLGLSFYILCVFKIIYFICFKNYFLAGSAAYFERHL